MRLSRKRLLERAACRRSSKVRGCAVRSRTRCLSAVLSVASRSVVSLSCCRLEFSELRLFTLLGIVQAKVVFSAQRLLRMPSGLEFDQVSFEPANTLLLGRAQSRHAAILRYSPRRDRIERLETGGCQQITEHDRRQLAMLVLQRNRGPIELDDRIRILAKGDPVPWPQDSCWFACHVTSRRSVLAARMVAFPSGLDRSPVNRPSHSRWNSTGSTRMESPVDTAASISDLG